MNQISFSETGFELKTKRTRRREFLTQMNKVIPWRDLVALIEPFAPQGKTGRPPFGLETMLRIHLLQIFFNLSDPAAEEMLYDMPLYREFAKLDSGQSHLPDETTILRFRHLLERHHLSAMILKTINAQLLQRGLMFKTGTIVDATILQAPTSTKNEAGERDPEMHQTKKGNQWHFGMKAHIGVDADSGLVHSVEATSANDHDVTQAVNLLHGEETDVFGDSGYRGVEKREEIQKEHADVNWHIAMTPGKRKALKKKGPDVHREKIEKIKASVRAKVEHPFRVLKQQFGFTKVRYRGIAKNTSRLLVTFAMSNLWMVRRVLIGQMTGLVRPKTV
jgi:transposase, IS5 family